MKRHLRDNPSEKYVQDAEKRLESLSENIEELRSRPLARPEIEVSDWELTIADFREGLRRLRSQLGELKRGGEKQWSELQAGAELQMWNLRAAVERAMDESRPLLARDAEDVPLYFIQRSEQGRWGLQRQNAAGVVKYFDNKKDAVQFGRQYARRKSPSTLIVRRRDGTFESVQSYR